MKVIYLSQSEYPTVMESETLIANLVDSGFRPSIGKDIMEALEGDHFFVDTESFGDQETFIVLDWAFVGRLIIEKVTGS